MKNADSVRQFVTFQFRQEIARRQLEFVLKRSFTEMLIEIGERIEDVRWLAAGARFGYFERTPAPFDERERALIARAISSPEALSWPASFRDLAAGFASQQSSEHSEYRDVDLNELRAVFQSIMITAEGFRDPVIRSLHWSLIAERSILDASSEPVAPEAVFRVIEDYEAESDPLATAVAGLIGLIDVVSALDEILSDRESNNTHWPLLSEVRPLLAWHLNLQDPRLVRRLGVVSRAFFTVVAAEFSRQSELRWSEEASRLHWQKLLLNWRWRLFVHEEDLEASTATDFLW